MSFLGIGLLVILFATALCWPWIAEEMVKSKHEAKEKKDPWCHVCYCEKCGYIGEFSFTRNVNYNRILGMSIYHCPKCNDIILNKDNRTYIPRTDKENAKLKFQAMKERRERYGY